MSTCIITLHDSDFDYTARVLDSAGCHEWRRSEQGDIELLFCTKDQEYVGLVLSSLETIARSGLVLGDFSVKHWA